MVKQLAPAHPAFGVPARNPAGRELRGWITIAPPISRAEAPPGTTIRSVRVSRKVAKIAKIAKSARRGRDWGSLGAAVDVGETAPVACPGPA